MKSFRPKSASGEGPGNGPGEPPGRNGEVNFRKTRRSNETHASTTDKDAREAAAAFSKRLAKGATLGADKGYDPEIFVEGPKARGIAPCIAINGTVRKQGKARKTAVPGEVDASALRLS